MSADVQPADHGFGLYGADFGYPGGGLCISSFLLVRREGQVLVGRMNEAEQETWVESWQPNLAYYEGAKWEAAFSGLRFPATYLREGEHPDQAAERVWTGQLGLPGLPELGAPTLISEAGPSRRSPGYEHWDLVFLYEVDGPEHLDAPPLHWAELGYRDPAELAGQPFGMLHGELLEHV